MMLKNLNVEELFAVLKSKTGHEITEQDFTQALGSNCTELVPKDLSDLFAAIDTDRSGSVSLVEIQAEFADIDVAMVLKDMKDSKMDIHLMFKTVDPSGKGHLDVM